MILPIIPGYRLKTWYEYPEFWDKELAEKK